MQSEMNYNSEETSKRTIIEAYILMLCFEKGKYVFCVKTQYVYWSKIILLQSMKLLIVS